MLSSSEAVPDVIECLQLSSASFLQRTVFSTGCAIKNIALHFGVCAVPGVDQLVFEKIKSRLGGRVKVIVSGGAPLASHVEHFLKLTMCCPVTQVRLQSALHKFMAPLLQKWSLLSFASRPSIHRPGLRSVWLSPCCEVIRYAQSAALRRAVATGCRGMASRRHAAPP
jgi:hypothetical protein